MSGVAQPQRGRPRLISVVMPVLNGEAHLGDQLASLAAQNYNGDWELVVVDNRCTDRSIEIVNGWRDRLPALVVADARSRRGLNRARNAGVAAARGDFIAFCDADDMTAPGWLDALAEAAPHSDIVGGAVDLRELNDDLRRAWQPSDPVMELSSSYDFLPYVSGGNCGIWADVARTVGWDEAFGFGSSDIDFGWRAQMAGYRLGFAGDALTRVRFRTSLRATARQYFRYGVSEPRLYTRHRHNGMRRDPDALETWLWLVRSPRLLLSETGRGHWVRVAASKCGRACGSLRWRVLFL